MRMIDKDHLIEEIRCSPIGQMLIRKYNLDGLIEKFPEVEAVPVSYIQQRIDRLRLLAEYEAEANGGYIGRSSMALFELEELIKYWKKEREQNDS